MKLGYARVSTDEQNLRLQIDALCAAGCEKIYEDKGVSGSTALKPKYMELMEHCREGDEIVVWKMDRLARSLPLLIAEMRSFEK